MRNINHAVGGEIFQTTATIEQMAKFFQTNKSLCKKLTIIQTSCHTLFERRPGFRMPGYCLIVTDFGNTREVEVRYFCPKSRFFSFARSNEGLKSLFEMFAAAEEIDAK